MAAKKRSTMSSAGKPIRVQVDKDSSVSVRQIENGFLISESGTMGKGRNKQYYSKEYYSKTNPLKITGGNGNGKMNFGRK